MQKRDKMQEIILDTLIDVLKLIPFLFLVFFLMEYMEHKLSEKSNKAIKKAGKFGPVLGSLLGALPQCGFSVAATNLFATKIITIGTLISIYLSTSDEMLAILISNKVSLSFIIYVLVIKIVIAFICGYIIDFIFSKRVSNKREIKNFCLEEHCHCENGILRSAIHHTLNIAFFILVVEFILNTSIHFLGENIIAKFLMGNTIFGSFLTSLLGLIPNCASSVIITELFLSGTIKFGSLIGGLLTGSGVSLLVLFKVNKNLKENISILIILYLIGALSGLLINILGLI